MWARSLNLNRASFVTIFDLPPLKYCPWLVLAMIIVVCLNLTFPLFFLLQLDLTVVQTAFPFQLKRESGQICRQKDVIWRRRQDGNVSYYAISQISTLPPAQLQATIWGSGKTANGLQQEICKIWQHWEIPANEKESLWYFWVLGANLEVLWHGPRLKINLGGR